MTIGYIAALRNARLDAITTFVGAGGKLRIYAGTKPATGGTATTLLSEHTLGTPFAPAASAGVLSPNLPANVNASATGTAAWFRVLKADGTTIAFDGTVGTSGQDLNLNTLSIVSGAAVAITAWTMTAGNP